MIDIFAMSQAFLREDQYRTRLVRYQQESILSFEDDAVLGFCFEFASPEALLRGWRDAETDVLNRFGARFRAAGEKSWVWSFSQRGPFSFRALMWQIFPTTFLPSMSGAVHFGKAQRLPDIAKSRLIVAVLGPVRSVALAFPMIHLRAVSRTMASGRLE